MAIWILEGERLDSSSSTYAALIDSVTLRPLGARLFDCSDDAEGYLREMERLGVDARSLDIVALDETVASWTKHRCPACYTLTCACEGCGVRCCEECRKGCAEADGDSGISLVERGRDAKAEVEVDDARDGIALETRDTAPAPSMIAGASISEAP